MTHMSSCISLYLSQQRPKSAFHRVQLCQVDLEGQVQRLALDKVHNAPRDSWEFEKKSCEERKDWSQPRIAKMEGCPVPNWLAKDKQILTFSSYFMDKIEDQGVERERLRKCNILYYLEDDSIKIVEPHDKNSGIPQGIIIT